MLIYFIAGIFSGISIAAFFLGKELYRISKENLIKKNEIERLIKLNKKMMEPSSSGYD